VKGMVAKTRQRGNRDSPQPARQRAGGIDDGKSDAYLHEAHGQLPTDRFDGDNPWHTGRLQEPRKHLPMRSVLRRNDQRKPGEVLQFQPSTFRQGVIHRDNEHLPNVRENVRFQVRRHHIKRSHADMRLSPKYRINRTLSVASQELQLCSAGANPATIGG